MIKFLILALGKLHAELQSILTKLPDIDQIDKTYQMLSDSRSDEKTIDLLAQNPIAKYLYSVPEFPAEFHETLNSQYLTIINTNLYLDLFSFDLTFDDSYTICLSMASSVAVYCIEAMHIFLSLSHVLESAYIENDSQNFDESPDSHVNA